VAERIGGRAPPASEFLHTVPPPNSFAVQFALDLTVFYVSFTFALIIRIPLHF
jgi:hypothetical protein